MAPGCHQNSRCPLFFSSVILSMWLFFLWLPHLTRWLLHYQPHSVIPGRKTKTRCQAGSSCATLRKAKLSRNPQQHSACVLSIRMITKSPGAARQAGKISIYSWVRFNPKKLKVLLSKAEWVDGYWINT